MEQVAFVLHIIHASASTANGRIHPTSIDLGRVFRHWKIASTVFSYGTDLRGMIPAKVWKIYIRIGICKSKHLLNNKNDSKTFLRSSIAPGSKWSPNNLPERVCSFHLFSAFQWEPNSLLIPYQYLWQGRKKVAATYQNQDERSWMRENWQSIKVPRLRWRSPCTNTGRGTNQRSHIQYWARFSFCYYQGCLLKAPTDHWKFVWK